MICPGAYFLQIFEWCKYMEMTGRLPLELCQSETDTDDITYVGKYITQQI